jgi:hypothetical protein
VLAVRLRVDAGFTHEPQDYGSRAVAS